ncbi:phosphonate C-P lyase system protein PhnH [Oceaniglobus trochenteri]|uniref:phosphonate C-P lyase system protein PhnH n=1 Tax=Oceaniglobus trochenteri TaxID=2763260 RepID=UPI001CFFC0D8|nr:phosphonate C-P lyase system protein PhnH [Oceaniglobus trochenteri]
MQAETLAGGFDTPAVQSAHAFRGLLEAMARPGTVRQIGGAAPPRPLSPAAGCALLTLCDTDTPVYLAGGADCDAVRAWLAFHTGAPLTGPSHCAFAIGRWEDLLPLSAYPTGTSEYPDRSATLIVDGTDFAKPGAVLRGPGISGQATMALPGIKAFQDNNALFPLGLDFIFAGGSRIAALPRSTKITAPATVTEVF